MSLLRAHTLAVSATASLAVACVLLGGELPAWCALFALLPWLWPLWQRLAGPPPAAPMAALAVAAVLGPLAWWLWRGGSQGTQLASIALMAILAVRQASRQLPSHDLQVLVLALLLVCVGAQLNPTPSYALLLPPVAVCMVAALLTRQLCFDIGMAAFRSGNHALAAAQLRRTDVVTPRFLFTIVALTTSILVMAGAVFVSFPRVGLPAFRGSQAHAMPTLVTLGATPWRFGELQVAARVFGLRRDAFNRGLYLRGRSYDRIDGDGFGESHVPTARYPLAGDGPSLRYEVVQDAAAGDPLLTLGPIERGDVITGDNDVVSLVPPAGGEDPLFVALAAGSHRARLVGPRMAWRPAPLPPANHRAPPQQRSLMPSSAFVDHYTALPEGMRQRLMPLVAQIFAQQLEVGESAAGVGDRAGEAAWAGATFATRAAQLRHYLAQHYAYDVREVAPSAAEQSPLLAFLFAHRRGNCTYFAAALAAMLRVAGVPCRIVGGFEGGRWDDEGAVAVFTGAHAHAWVEWFAPGRGWVADDATPAQGGQVLEGVAMWRERLGRYWQLGVLQFGLGTQLAMVESLRAGFTALQRWALPAKMSAPAPWRLPRQQQAFWALGSLAVLATLGSVWWRAWRRRVPPSLRLGRIIERALVRRLHRALRPQESYRQAATGLQAASPAALQRALTVYEAMRFGRQPAPADLNALLAKIRRL